jgi:hypothetical protein
MRSNIILIILLSLFGCLNPSSKGNVQITSSNPTKSKDSTTPEVATIAFKHERSQAILIGNSITLLDENLKPIADISKQSGNMVDVLGVSDSLFNDTKEFCNAFWYVQIKIGDKEGIVNGRQVYKILSSDQDTSLLINGKAFEILTTEFFGMGVGYEGDLTACPVNQPVVIRDDNNRFMGLAIVIKNELLKEAVWDHDFSFFQLQNDDGAYDKIISIVSDNSNIRLKIHRSFQEGENDYEILLKFDQNHYTAEYLTYGEIKYE